MAAETPPGPSALNGSHADPAPPAGLDSGAEPVTSAPSAIQELADACIRYVLAATGLRLDYELETLPLLDYYLSSHRSEFVERPETAALVLRAAGAYFGELVRRRIGGFWRGGGPAERDLDTTAWEFCASPVFLSFNPFAVAFDAVFHGDEAGPTAKLQLEDEDREALEARLADLPDVSEDEFYQLSTRLEVLDIAVDVAKNRMIEAGLGDVVFTVEDYG